MIPQEFIERLYDRHINKVMPVWIEYGTNYKKDMLYGIYQHINQHSVVGLSRETRQIVLPMIICDSPDERAKERARQTGGEYTMTPDIHEAYLRDLETTRAYKAEAFLSMLKMARERENKSIKFTWVNCGGRGCHAFTTEKFSDIKDSSKMKNKIIQDGWGKAHCFRIRFTDGLNYELDKIEEIRCKGGWPLDDKTKEILKLHKSGKTAQEMATALDSNIDSINYHMQILRERTLIE